MIIINPRFAFFVKLLGAIILMVVLALVFPPVMRFVEMAARDVVRLWWVILLLLLAVWLIWGLGGKKK